MDLLPDIRPTGYPANLITVVRYQISGVVGILISGHFPSIVNYSLIKKIHLCTFHRLLFILCTVNKQFEITENLRFTEEAS